MKNLKNLIAIAAFLGTAIAANAQVKFGVDAEIGVSTVKYEEDDDFESYSESYSGFGWNVGVFADIPAGSLVVQPGFQFGGKMSKDGDWSTNNIGIEVPVLVGYPISLGGSGLKLRPELGPVFGVGISWKDKYDGKKFDNDYSEDDDLKRFRLGLKVGAMLEINEHFAVGLHEDLGLNDQDDSDDFKTKWHFFGARVAFTF